MKKNKILLLSLGIGIYVIGAVGGYFLFSKKTPIAYVPPAKTINGTVAFDDSLPKTEACPLNGVLYSKQQRDWWEKHRPLGVMIENHPDARPQSGLSSADIIYEAVAEGGITRFLSVFYCQTADVGPVRSARTYFVDFISEYGKYPLYAHVGGANSEGPANALGQIEDYGWGSYNDLSEFAIGCPIYCRLEAPNGHEVATEHTVFSNTSKLWDYAAKNRGITNVDKQDNSWETNFAAYTFKDDVSLSQRPVVQTVHLEFWQGYTQFFIDWIYDKTTNVYKRNTGGAQHLDRNTKKQITAKNIVVLKMIQQNANDGYENNLHLLYKDKGVGKAVIFMDGTQVNGTWRKDSRTDHLYIYDASGNVIKFDRGLIWFEVLPAAEGVLTVS